MRINLRKALALMISLLMLCILIPMGAMTSVSAEETVVYSADFENGSVSGWYTSGSGAMTAVSTSELPVANAACGNYVMKKVQPTGEYSWQEYQTGFTVKANTDYVATVDVLTTSNNWPIQAFVSSSTWITNVLGQSEQVNCSSSEWTTLTFEFNSGNNTKLYPSVKSAWESTTLYVDNFKIVEKPAEPEPEIPASSNLVVNGDFEDGSNGWKLGTGASIVSGGYTGSAFQMSNPSAWAETGYQEVAVEANETYTMTWRSKRVSGTGVFNMEIAKAPYDGTKPQVTAVTNQTWMNDTSGNWIDHKVSIKMTDANGNGISKIMIKLTSQQDNAGVILIDDICLTKNLTASFDGYIYNGDFEIGNTDNWTCYNNTCASTAAKYSGSYGAHLKSNGSWGGVMYQSTVNVVARKTYIISFYAKVIKNSMNLQIKDGNTSGSVLSSKTLTATEWTLITVEATPTQNGFVINFNGSGGQDADPNNIGEAYVDDIKVELKGGNPEEKVEYSGSSVRDNSPAEEGATGKGLAFQFKVSATGGSKNYQNEYQGDGKIELGNQKYTLVRMGAVMTNNATVGQNADNFNLGAVNGTKVIDIPAVYLNGVGEDYLSFAVRICDIPDKHIGTAIYARPYYVYLDNGEEVTVYGATRSNNYAKAANISTADKTKPIKILSIGHSFSKDVMTTNLYNMFVEGGYTDITIGYLYMAGCSMPKHLYNIQNNKAQYEYAKNNSGRWVTKNNTTALSALQEEDWDFVTVQSSPDYIGGQTISSFKEGINNNGTQVTLSTPMTEYEAMDQITDWIKANATNPDVKIDYHMIWSFSQDCELWSGMYHKDPNTGKYSQMVMWQNIVNITQQKVQNHEDINRVIPSATAIQNVRSSFMGDNFNMPVVPGTGADGYHLNDYGDYVAALTWYCHYSGDNAEIMAGYLGDGSVLNLTNEEFFAIAEAVNNAIDVPYAVTESTHK